MLNIRHSLFITSWIEQNLRIKTETKKGENLITQTNLSNQHKYNKTKPYYFIAKKLITNNSHGQVS